VDAKLRQNGTWAGLHPPVVLGYDASGVVDAVGAGVTDLREGDEVFYTPEIHGNPLGTYAEYNVVPASIVAPKPAGLSHVDAAAVPLAGGTAWEGIVRRLCVRVGETVLIHGGAGGVGSFAVQVAKAAGCRVLSTAGPENQQALRDLGADVAIDYRAQDFVEVAKAETGGRGVDAVFDTVGGDTFGKSLGALRHAGRIATILAPGGDLGSVSRNNITIHGIFLTRERRRLEEMAVLLERGQMRPLVEEVIPLEDVRKAHERLDSGHGRGKIILRIAEG
jgi:NADPH2:quinone reductase